MKGKTIAIVAGIGVVGLMVIAYNKVVQLKSVFDRMKLSISGISDLKITWDELSCKMNVDIFNPTNTAFSVTGASLARLRSLTVYREGVFLGTALLNLEEIEIPSYATATISGIPFTISLKNVLDNVLTLQNFDVSKLTIRATIEVLGTEYTIDN